MMYRHSHMIQSALNDCQIMPHNYCPSRFYEFKLEGFKVSLSIDDSEYNLVANLAASIVATMASKYKDTHVFSFPIFGFNVTSNFFYLKLGTLEKEQFETIYNKSCQE